jgi:hypothetical protein
MEPPVKLAILTLAAALCLAPAYLPSVAAAKSVKWHCVALDPAHPSNYYCTASTSRP